MRTPLFTSGASSSTCVAGCYGDTLFSADCSVTNCGSRESNCLPGPPSRCSDPPPPEPSEAVAVPNAPRPRVSEQGSLARFTYIAPRRLFDTRTAAGSTNLTRGNGTVTGPLTATGTNTFTDPNWGNYPGTQGIWLNVTARGATEAGYLSVFPVGGSRPETSNINYSEGIVRGNAVPVGTSAGGFSIFAHKLAASPSCSRSSRASPCWDVVAGASNP